MVENVIVQENENEEEGKKEGNRGMYEKEDV